MSSAATQSPRTGGDAGSPPATTGARKTGLWYALTLFVVRSLSILLFDLRVFGVRHVPGKGAVMLASTHQSFLDPVLIATVQDRPCAFLAKDALFRIPFFGRLIGTYNAFAIPRENVSARKSLDVCIRILRMAHSLVFFPEGTRTRDGRIQPLRRGVGLIAKRSLTPVVPIVIRGAHECWPKGVSLPRPGAIDVLVGAPISLQEKESTSSFTDRLAGCYRRLAVSRGATSLPGEEPGSKEAAEGRKEAPAALDDSLEPETLRDPRETPPWSPAQPRWMDVPAGQGHERKLTTHGN